MTLAETASYIGINIQNLNNIIHHHDVESSCRSYQELQRGNLAIGCIEKFAPQTSKCDPKSILWCIAMYQVVKGGN